MYDDTVAQLQTKKIIFYSFSPFVFSHSQFYLSFTLSLSLSLSLSLIELLPPHSFSHLTSLFLVQSLHRSWVGFVVTTWKSPWILDGSEGGAGIGGGSVLVGGMVVVWWLCCCCCFLFIYLFIYFKRLIKLGYITKTL